MNGKRRIECLAECIAELLMGLVCLISTVYTWSDYDGYYRYTFLLLTVFLFALFAYSLRQYICYDKPRSDREPVERKDYLMSALLNLFTAGLWGSIGVMSLRTGRPDETNVINFCLLVVVCLTWGLKAAVQAYCWFTYSENIEATGGIENE